MKKVFVLDTSAFFHNPEILLVLQDEEVVVPLNVVELLGGYKKCKGIWGDTTRLACRLLYSLGHVANSGGGIPLAEGGTLKVIAGGIFDKDLPHPKNEVLQVAQQVIKSSDEGVAVVVVSYDTAIKLEGNTYGITVEPFGPEQVARLENKKEKLGNTLFEGVRPLYLPASVLNELKHDNSALRCNDDLYDAVMSESIAPVPNEFLKLVNEEDHEDQLLARIDPLRPEKLRHVNAVSALQKIKSKLFGPELVHDPAQIMALELMLDPTVPIVTEVGEMTPLELSTALVGGIEQMWKKQAFSRIHYIRPVAPLDPTVVDDDQAFNEITGCLEEIQQAVNKKPETAVKIVLDGESEEDEAAGDDDISIMTWLEEDLITREGLRHVNGPIFEKTFLIVDQCQNLTPHQLKTLLKRVGEDSKVVLIGDLSKVDNPFLDASTCAFAYVVDRFKAQGTHGHATFGTKVVPAMAQMVDAFL